MITSENRAVLLDDEPTEIYSDGEIMLFTLDSLRNAFNARRENYEPGAFGEDDEGLQLSEKMIREILQVRFGVGQHVMKVDGKPIRLWKTTCDKWPRERVHFDKEYLQGANIGNEREWNNLTMRANRLPEEPENLRQEYKDYSARAGVILPQLQAKLWELEAKAGLDHDLPTRGKVEVSEKTHRLLFN